MPQHSDLVEVWRASMPLENVRFIRNREVVSRRIEGELIVVPIRHGVGDLNFLYTLNPVGSVIWDCLAEGHTLREMVHRVCEKFEVLASQADEDIQRFLDSLLEEKLIQPLACAPAAVAAPIMRSA